MTEAEVFILADDTLNKVVQQIADDQWAMPIPGWFQLGRTQGDETLRTIINYHAYDEAWVTETLAGKTMAAADGVPRDMTEDLLGDDPKGNFAALTAKGIAAVRALDDPERITHLSYGDYPAREYLLHTLSFRGFRAFDIAKLIGADTKLPDELVQGMWDLFSPHFDTWRQMGVFKTAVPVPSDASLQDKLIAGSGRDPR
jgi:uncharacterized protein (TIGR03086 family)